MMSDCSSGGSIFQCSQQANMTLLGVSLPQQRQGRVFASVAAAATAGGFSRTGNGNDWALRPDGATGSDLACRKGVFVMRSPAACHAATLMAAPDAADPPRRRLSLYLCPV
jgi:hypothetical protein